MKRILPFVLLIGGLLLFTVAFMFYQKSEDLKRETEALRDLTAPPSSSYEAAEAYEPEYDPTDINQTPPGVTPFVFGSVCAFNWGTHLRQYCEGGDGANLETVEGTTLEENMGYLTNCLNEMMQRIDVYGDRNLRYIDSEVALDQTNRQALACDMTEKYGSSPVFENASIGYMIKEHLESGNISRLEKRK